MLEYIPEHVRYLYAACASLSLFAYRRGNAYYERWSATNLRV
jgi:hypothetical protein